MPTPETSAQLPKHIAIVMDGNGRWAKQRRLMRKAGHRAGLQAAKKIVEQCAGLGIEALTLFAFSQENWRRPKQEVGHLMDLFLSTFEQESKRLHEHNVRVQFIGDASALSPKLQEGIQKSQALTAGNTGLKLQVAMNYGGRWDVLQGVRTAMEAALAGELDPATLTESQFSELLSTQGLPEVDLFIRTSGEVRVSNFLLWQMAYAELYFTDILWPDFSEAALDAALQVFTQRQRRFGALEAVS